jgi:hypothetical protein
MLWSGDEEKSTTTTQVESTAAPLSSTSTPTATITSTLSSRRRSQTNEQLFGDTHLGNITDTMPSSSSLLNPASANGVITNGIAATQNKLDVIPRQNPRNE